jgi:hypothetical protein
LNKSKQQFEVFVGFPMSTMKKKKTEKKETKNNNLFSFELGFQINNLVELGLLKIFYIMCLTFKKKKEMR